MLCAGIPREALAAACDEAVRNMSKWLDLVAVTLIGKTFRPLVVLEDHRGKLSKALSGGNKRKLSVALAFLGNPKVNGDEGCWACSLPLLTSYELGDVNRLCFWTSHPPEWIRMCAASCGRLSSEGVRQETVGETKGCSHLMY